MLESHGYIHDRDLDGVISSVLLPVFDDPGEHIYPPFQVWIIWLADDDYRGSFDHSVYPSSELREHGGAVRCIESIWVAPWR